MEILGALLGFILACLLLWGAFWLVVFTFGFILIVLASPIFWFIAFCVAVWFLLDERKRKT